MLVPKKWLSDYITGEIDTAEFENKMVMAGNAIEHTTHLGDDIQNVVTGKILNVEKHPDADKLSVCTVDIGVETTVIVTGATNVYAGAIVPCALNNSRLPGGVTIKASKLRGVLSNGMMCSGKELAIDDSVYPGASDDRGIMLMKEDTPIGLDVADFLGLRDTVFEFEVGANRPDCLSVLGIARETSCALNQTLTLPHITFGEAGGTINDYISVHVEDTDICPRYMARAIKNVKIEESPKWLKDRLRSAGVRPINNIVDITNFVMLECGQPMHAFDLNDIVDKKIIVRRAKDSETITTLDEKKHTLNPSMLMICDGEKPIGIAGIMGGENSEIKESTTTVIFEAAKFAYGSVRQTSRALGISTESAMRFSKGVDSANVSFAMHRALHLVEKLKAGEIVTGEIDILNENISPKVVKTTGAKINALLGTGIEASEMQNILNRLHLPTTLTGDELTVSVSGLRSDISGAQDIAEEVARIYGYDNIPARVMQGHIVRGRVSDMEKLRDALKTLMIRSGFFESITYSFGSPDVVEKLLVDADDFVLKNTITLKNPLGDDKSVMRTQGIADLLNVVATNLNRKVKNVRLFELGRVYLPETLPLTELPDEQEYLCLSLCGEDEDFYSLKSVIENVLWVLNIKNASFHPGGRSFYHPGRKAVIMVDGVGLGSIGEIHPTVAKNFGMEGEKVYCALLYLKPLYSAIDNERKYSELPRFPAIERDLAFVVDKQLFAGELLTVINKSGGKYLEHVQIFDVYTGASVGEGKKSLAFALTFRAKDKTLADEDITKNIEKIIKSAEREFGATLRS